MRTAKTILTSLLLLLGASLPGSVRGEIATDWRMCELRYVNRGTGVASRCLGCHDGSAGAPVATGHGSHPVEVSYVAALSQGGGYRPVEEIERRNFVLAFGKVVTCTTCHDGRSRLHARTASTEMCSGCHDR
jgi:hypothetical protein